MILLLTIFGVLLFILIVKWILPIFKRHSQLQKDYQNISLLPVSSIPFVGNVHQFDKKTYIFYKLILQLAKQCQDQDKGLFCIWLSLSPVIFLCSAKGLEVLTVCLLMKFHFFLLI
jgi:hypothetical protein